MNYKIKVLALFLVMSFLHGCAGDTLKPADKDEDWRSHKPMLVMKEKIENKRENKLNALKLLDETLSPFEDMTEYALESDDVGMNKTLKNIQDNQNRYPNFKSEVKQFEGLELSVKDKDTKMLKILAHMDLSLVDSIEKHLQ